MLRTALPALAATLALAPAAKAADAPSTYLSGRTFHCWQSFASYAPNGRLSGYNRATRGRVAFATDYVPSYLRTGQQGAFEPTARGVRFTSGRFYQPAKGWRLIGEVHPDGVAMPRDLRKGTRYQLILRSAPGRFAVNDAAPPRRMPANVFLTPWYCETIV